jgi:hypothetical protein
MTALTCSPATSIDESMSAWKQGDFTLDKDLPFCHIADLNTPLTNEAEEVAQHVQGAGDELGLESIYVTVEGLAILTQTCDLVRDCEKRQYVEVAPLVKIEDKFLEEIKRWKRPRYAYLAGCSKHNLVVDLDRVVTIEKTVVAGWTKNTGCLTDQDVRDFAQQLTRKWSRFAFPNEFEEAFLPVSKLVEKRCGKDHKLGLELDRLNQIRVLATPAWNEDKVKLVFWFVKGAATDDKYDWNSFFEEFKANFKSTKYEIVDCTIISLDDMSARQYLDSDKIDFDQLSSKEK